MSDGQITKRDLFKWGLLTTTGMIAAKHGLSPFVRSAYAAVPTGTPPSPIGTIRKFSAPMNRLALQPTHKLTYDPNVKDLCGWPDGMGERPASRLSYHTHYNEYYKLYGNNPAKNPYCNPVTGRGPCEGRPWGEMFAHQRWNDKWMRPTKGVVMTWGQVAPKSNFHPDLVNAGAYQNPNSVWSFGTGAWSRGNIIPPLIQARYGEPLVTRIYNNTPKLRTENGGFGRNENSLHNHNAHNGAESDGACNAYHLPGTFYDYHWAMTLARHDTINHLASDPRASGPDGNGGLVNVPGDWKELQGTLWYHDHRFFFTAENVYKGNFGMLNVYSGRDRGNEVIDGGKGADGKPINLKLPSGVAKDWGNIDFDVNLIFGNIALDQQGQLFFDIFDTDGFLGDIMHVNGTYAPYFEVLPRKYRFRMLNASMSRFIKLGLVNAAGNGVPFQVISADGNLLQNPVLLSALEQQGPAERYDVIIDFAQFVNQKLWFVNMLQQTSGKKWDKELTFADALKGGNGDPCVGKVLEFRVVSEVKSVDEPGTRLRMSGPSSSTVRVVKNASAVPLQLTENIKIVAPDRERVIEWTSGGGDLADASQCFPDCGEAKAFPWTVKVNGQAAHSANANRIGLLVPDPGKVEHWTYVNGGGGWDHPIHLHFEEGVTIDRGGAPIGPLEKNVRKDVWRLRPGGRVKFQVRFGEFGGAYVNHCHNTVHEDFAMLLRYQLWRDDGGKDTVQYGNTLTPRPSEDGVTYVTPSVLPEGDPRSKV